MKDWWEVGWITWYGVLCQMARSPSQKVVSMARCREYFIIISVIFVFRVEKQMTSVHVLTFKEMPCVLGVSLAGQTQLRSQVWVKLGGAKSQLVMHKQDNAALVVVGKGIERCFECLPLDCREVGMIPGKALSQVLSVGWHGCGLSKFH